MWIWPQGSAGGGGGSSVQKLIKSGPLHYLGNQALHRKPIIGHVVPYGSWIIQLTISLLSVPDSTPGLCSVCGGHRGVRIDGTWSNLQPEYHNFAQKTNNWSHGPAWSQVNPVDYFTSISARFDPRLVQGVWGAPGCRDWWYWKQPASRIQQLCRENQSQVIWSRMVPRLIQLTISLVSVPDLTPGLGSVCVLFW